MNKADFLATRRTGIGGSDIGAILGLSQWRTPYDVFLEKTAPETQPDTAGEAAYWGTVLEDVVASEYQIRTGRRVQRVRQTMRHPEYDFAIANIDRAIINPDISGTVRWKGGRLTTDSLLECKTANSFAASEWGDAGTDNVPDSYLCQCQWYLGVTDTQVADLAVLIGGQDYRIYTIERDPELFADMIEAAGTFWENCQKGIAPDPATVQDAARKWPRHIAGKSIIVDINIANACEQLENINARIKSLNEEADDLKRQIMTAFGDAEEITCQGNAGNILVAIQWGIEIGLQPLQAMQNIAVINGRPAIWGDAMLAIVRGSGLLEYIREEPTDESCTCTIKRKGEDPVTRTFTMAMRLRLWRSIPCRQKQKRRRRQLEHTTTPAGMENVGRKRERGSMMGEFLDPKEIAHLTGYKTNTDQIKWLRDRGFIFLINARNAPVVSRIYCRQRLSGKAASILETEPDFSQVKK